MKKAGFFFLLLLVLTACGPSDNAVDIAQAQSIIEAARAAQDAAQAAQIASQGLSDVGLGQTLTLVLLILALVILVGLVVYVAIQRQIWKHNRAQPKLAGRWISGPNAHWRRVASPDPYEQLLLQQQMLFTQLLQQSQENAAEDDHPQLPDEWWG